MSHGGERSLRVNAIAKLLNLQALTRGLSEQILVASPYPKERIIHTCWPATSAGSNTISPVALPRFQVPVLP